MFSLSISSLVDNEIDRFACVTNRERERCGVRACALASDRARLIETLATLPFYNNYYYKYLYRIKISAILLFYKLSCSNSNQKKLLRSKKIIITIKSL